MRALRSPILRPRLLALAACLLAGSAQAATFTINDPGAGDDANPGDGACQTAAGTCTLDAALEEAEALTGADEIDLAGLACQAGWHDVTGDLHLVGPGSFALSLDVHPGASLSLANLSADLDTLHSTGARLQLTDVTLRPLPTSNLVLDGGSIASLTRVDLDGAPASVDGSSLTWTGGSYEAPGGFAGLSVTNGNAILSNVVVSESATQSPGPAAFALDGGSFSCDGCTVAVLDGNGVLDVTSGSAILSHGSLTGQGDAYVASTGVALVRVRAGSLDLETTTLSDQDEIGVEVDEGAHATLRDVQISRVAGTAVTSSGDLEMERVTIEGTQPLSYGILCAGSRDGTALRIGGGAATIERCTVEDGHSGGSLSCPPDPVVTGHAPCAGISVGGGIVVIRDSSIVNNSSHGTQGADGGGLSVSGGTVTIARSLLTRNTTAGDGGGLLVNGGDVTLVNCTLSGNVASQGIDPVDTTISSDDIPYGGHGGGAYLASGSLRLLSTTVAANSAGVGGGGLATAAAVEPSLDDSILAGNGEDCRGAILSDGWNLVQDASTCAIDGDATGLITGVDPQLLPLADNGGPTWTRALATTSPARDAANPSGNRAPDGSPLLVDQRGRRRPVDGNGDGSSLGDLGAFEACEDPTDSDGDTVGDACDNCPDVANPTQDDANENGIGDACDAAPECPEVAGVQLVRTSDGTTLTWLPSSASAYDILEGTLAALRAGGDHEPIACGVAGTSFALAPAAGAHYYLVGARCTSGGSTVHGTLGRASSGRELPPPTSPCP